jgi:hypothetical protein
MNHVELLKITEKFLRDNSTTILTALGVSGTVSTAYLASKASFKASRILIEEERFTGRSMGKKEAVRCTWKLYIPTTLSGVLTIGCIIGGTRIGMKRTAAAYSLLTVSETAFSEYKDKVVEQIGVKKEQAVRDEIAQDRVKANAAVIVAGTGTVLCYEMHTGRYFNCDMETLRKAENTINAKILREMEATLSDFYYLVGLPHTSYSSGIGWTSDKMMNLSFSTVMSEDSRPCIAFEYNYVKQL